MRPFVLRDASGTLRVEEKDGRWVFVGEGQWKAGAELLNRANLEPEVAQALERLEPVPGAEGVPIEPEILRDLWRRAHEPAPPSDVPRETLGEQRLLGPEFWVVGLGSAVLLVIVYVLARY
jgi:hypothetical protein